MSTPLLSAKNLRAFYGPTQILYDIDFDMHAGGITTLLGANGAGKTTTLRALSGMVKTAGEIRFDGKLISNKETADIVRLGVAHVPEGRGTFVRQTVEENLQLGGITQPAGQIAADIDLVFTYFPRLKERFRQQAGTLSGGEQQMFGILRRLNQKEKVSMFLVEQNASLALELADHAYLLETGRVVMSGPAKELSQDENIRRAYLGY